MDVDFFADFHLCNGCIEAADHLAHTADELERFAAVVGRIKLGSIVEGSSVVGTAGFSDILTFHNRSRCTASAAAGSAGTMINDDVYGKLTADEIPGILQKYMD